MAIGITSTFVGKVCKGSIKKVADDSLLVFNVAVKAGFKKVEKDGETKWETVFEFAKCIAWMDGVGGRLEKILREGQLLQIEATLRTREYTDSKEVKRTAYEWKLSDFDVLSAPPAEKKPVREDGPPAEVESQGFENVELDDVSYDGLVEF